MSQTKVCDIVKKEINFARSKDFIKIVYKGKYLCNKCGHVARNKENLCKPIKMKKRKINQTQT
jgi:hypothetical protein